MLHSAPAVHRGGLVSLPSCAARPHNSRSLSSRLAITCSAAPVPTQEHTVEEDQRVSFTDGSGVSFAPILNGCWTLAGGHGTAVYQTVGDTLAAAAEAGFTTFDTADIYGPSEKILGEFQRQWTESGHQPVEVFTKYVPNIFQQRVTPGSVESAITRSLKALQADQLDCVQMHWWDYSIPGMVDAGLALTDLKARGLIRSVAVTNMDCAALEQLVAAGVPVAANQVQFSLLDRRPLNGMVQFCQERGIRLLTYGSVGGGLLSDRYVEEPRQGLFGKPKYSNIDLNTSSLKMYWNVVSRFGGQDLYRRLVLVLSQVASKHGCSVANVALRWVMDQGDGATIYPIVGLRSPTHLQDNLRVLCLKLDEADRAAIQEVLQLSSGPGGDIYSFERGG